MASFNLTAEDSSPLISYSPSGAWKDSPSNDTLIGSYSGQSLHTSTARGANATLNSNGTAVWLFGGRRPGYGNYTFTLDGMFTANGNAGAASPSTRQLLGMATNLSNGPHTIVLANTGNGTSLDFDWVVLESQTGPSSTNSSVTIDDTNPVFTYFPSNTWSLMNSSDFINDTLHSSGADDTTTSLSFNGDAVAVFGTVSPGHANVQLSLNGSDHSVNGGANGVAGKEHPQTLMFFANNLGMGEHNITMKSSPQATAKALDLDVIKVFGTNMTNATDTSSAASSARTGTSAMNMNGVSSKSSHKAISGAAIAVIVAGSVGAVIIILTLFVFLNYRKRKRRAKRSTIFLPIQYDDSLEGGLECSVRSSVAESASQYSSDVSSSSLRHSYPDVVGLPAPPVSIPWRKHRAAGRF